MALNIADVPQWLINKLGPSEKTWVDGSIAPFLTKDFLKEVHDCFPDLPAAVKIKLLLSFLHIVRRNLDTLRPELESIIEMAINDEQDQWVSLTAEFLKTFPAKGEFNLNVLENSAVFNEMRNDIKKHLKKLADKNSELHFVPYEAELMNRKAFVATFGNIAPPQKHFTLKQKPKSATLRAEALAKASDPSKPRLQPGSLAPTRLKDASRAVDNSFQITPAAKRALAAGAMSRVQAAKVQALAVKSRSGVKLLDITEQPLGQEVGSKRRRKLVGVPVNAPGESSRDDDNAEIPGQLERPDSPDLGEQEKNTETAPSGSQDSATPLPHSPEMPPPLQPYQSVLAPGEPSSSSIPFASTSTGNVSPDRPPQQTAPHSAPGGTTQIVQATAVPLADLKNMKLSKEIQTAIAETFANANRVTRPEKILIINFIAGVRENPCPHLGPILTIRLSEHPTQTTLPDGREVDTLVEEYFHMNFATGEWKRLRKHKPLVKDPVVTPAQQPKTL
ncbi:putative Negative elongation factor A [Hypsibius exemplaris]|uniref:Negative elongation factor A n=1 Tax=Hypsibius exemplaris TaxID=2072580 RepID=A0A1W0X9R2_HYPEX|nr:putative Negative elongation factor A [Hypsibius exemplaris]